jgi:hypothetical protein
MSDIVVKSSANADSEIVRWLKKRYWRVLDTSQAFWLRRAANAWKWSALDRCLDSRLDAAAAQHGDLLYLFGGFSGADVCTTCDVLDLRSGRWVQRFECPPEVAHSHLAVTVDEQGHVYMVGGQVGNNCRPATRDAFVLDLNTRTWSSLPPLPEARYAPTMQLWNGRLHLVGGSREDRYTPSAQHWSLSVSSGRALKPEWDAEQPLPHGRCHFGSALVENVLYVFGGQQGDFIAYANDAECTCNGRTKEMYLADVYRLSSRNDEWERLRDMPVPTSHLDFSTAVVDGFVYLFGGQIEKDDTNGNVLLTDAIQRYDVTRDKWDIVGFLPFRVKTCVVAHWNGWIYFTTGARDLGRDNPVAGPWLNQCWRARLPAYS